MAEEGTYSGFGIVDLMGHLRRAGKISEVESFGTKLLRVDIPVAGEADGEEEWVTEYYGGGAIYSLRPATEAVAREAARRIGDPRPPNPVGFLPPARGLFGEGEPERGLFGEPVEEDDEP
jgi:hypothetical protein